MHILISFTIIHEFITNITILNHLAIHQICPISLQFLDNTPKYQRNHHHISISIPLHIPYI